jgi:O-methyltransferase involved in polyketide biosynthesis
MGDDNIGTANFDKISPTALLCARIRAEYTNIPYTKEIYELLPKNKTNSLEYSSLKNNQSLAKRELSVIEGRYLAINDSLKKIKNPQILELASGLSSRFFEYSNDYAYIETDLAEMVLLKKRIAKQIKNDFNLNNILPLNPLNSSEFFAFEKYFKKTKDSPITIVNEGLMMYLSTNEQKLLRDNIANFLGKYSENGYWITTDFSSRQIEKNNLVKSVMTKIEIETERKFNRFEDEKSVHKFLDKGGLTGEPLSNYHLIDKLSCLEKLNLNKEDASSISNIYKAWKIKLK